MFSEKVSCETHVSANHIFHQGILLCTPGNATVWLQLYGSTAPRGEALVNKNTPRGVRKSTLGKCRDVASRGCSSFRVTLFLIRSSVTASTHW